MTSENLQIEKKELFVPPIEHVAKVLASGLENNFRTVSVEVVDCPDLSKEPYFLASKGLGGSPVLLEVGGPPYLLPVVDREKIYDIKTILKTAQIPHGTPQALVIGAGAGPWMYAGQNCEMIANVLLSDESLVNQTHIAKIKSGDIVELETLPESETRCALLANLFCCQGKPGKVLKVSCKNRSGKENFISAIRCSLENEYGDKPVGLGGTFLLKSGTARHHVMPDFSKKPIYSEDELNEWLKFVNFNAPLVSVGTLVSCDIEDLDLRLQHFHTFSKHGVGGHYHYDVTPEEVEYIGYFNIAKHIYRIDKPVETHKFGRD